MMRPSLWSYQSLHSPHHSFVQLLPKRTMRVRSLKFAAEVNNVGRIQQLVTPIIKHFHRLPYQERPQDLCLYSFARLHFCGDLNEVLMLKIIFSLSRNIRSSLRGNT